MMLKAHQFWAKNVIQNAHSHIFENQSNLIIFKMKKNSEEITRQYYQKK